MTGHVVKRMPVYKFRVGYVLYHRVNYIFAKNLVMKRILVIYSMLLVVTAYGQSDVLKEVDAAVDEASKKKVIDSLVWDKGGTFNLNFSQVGLKNWAGGGDGSVALGSLLSWHANYTEKKTRWVNTIDLAYGVTRVGNKDQLFKKSDDQLILVSKYSHKLKKSLSLTGLLDFRSQFAPGFTYVDDSTSAAGERKDAVVSRLFAPAYAILSAGLEIAKKDKYFVVVSPLAGKITIVADDDLNAVGAYGVDTNSVMRFELGYIVKTGLKFKLMKNVNFKTNLTIFSGYKTLEHIDVNWETLLVMKVNKYLSTTFSTLLIYDDDVNIEQEKGKVGPAVQFKNVLGVGLMYKF